LNADQEDGASADGVRGSVTQTTGATSVAPTADTVALSINASNGIGSVGQSFIFDADTLATDSSSLNANQFLAEINTVTATALTAGTGTIPLTGGTFKLNSGTTINDSTDMNVLTPAVLDLNGNSETFDGLNGTGSVTSGVAGAVTLTVGF